MKEADKQALIDRITLCSYMVDEDTKEWLIDQIDRGNEFDVKEVYNALVIANKILDDTLNKKAKEYAITLYEENLGEGGYIVSVCEHIDGKDEAVFNIGSLWNVPNYITQLLGEILMKSYDE